MSRCIHYGRWVYERGHVVAFPTRTHPHPAARSRSPFFVNLQAFAAGFVLGNRESCALEVYPPPRCEPDPRVLLPLRTFFFVGASVRGVRHHLVRRPLSHSLRSSFQVLSVSHFLIGLTALLCPLTEPERLARQVPHGPVPRSCVCQWARAGIRSHAPATPRRRISCKGRVVVR